VWAKDFLDHYDSSTAIGGSQQQQPTNEMAEQWEREFQQWQQAQQQNEAGTGMDFYDYESTWAEIHSKEAQERYTFTQVKFRIHSLIFMIFCIFLF
jgi:membrane-bound lytic murein transglycosylase